MNKQQPYQASVPANASLISDLVIFDFPQTDPRQALRAMFAQGLDEFTEEERYNAVMEAHVGFRQTARGSLKLREQEMVLVSKEDYDELQSKAGRAFRGFGGP